MRVVILILSLMLVSYLVKMCGSDTFNKFITNETFVSISTFIDTNIVLNMIVYGLLNFYITYFIVASTSLNLKLKWWQFLIVFVISMGFAVLRYYFYGLLTYLFDLLQYIVVPIVLGFLFTKSNLFNSTMISLITYFLFNGLLFINKTLCDLASIYYSSNLIAYVLCFIEPYLFIIAFSIFIINGGCKNDKSNIISK